MRNIGGSVGIAASTSTVQSGAQRRERLFAPHLTLASTALHHCLETATNLLAPHVGSANAVRPAYALIDQLTIQRAQLLSYVRDFQVLSFLALLLHSRIAAVPTRSSPARGGGGGLRAGLLLLRRCTGNAHGYRA
ncbi:MAG TPA: hypothetical protein VK797_00855 [Tepidisphaeraceae bacterium]|nr:hypothetical protein [Tepidisphaeraceae bacterium]